MGFEMHEIKKTDINKDVWNKVMEIYIACFEKNNKNKPKYLEKCCQDYIKLIGTTNEYGKNIWLAAMENEDVLGFANIHTKGRKYCYVDFVGIDPDIKVAGKGKMIMDWLSRKYNIVELDAIAGVTGFYKKCGFKKSNILITGKEEKEEGAEMFKINLNTKESADALRHKTLDSAGEDKKSKDDTNRSKLRKFDKKKRKWQK